MSTIDPIHNDRVMSRSHKSQATERPLVSGRLANIVPPLVCIPSGWIDADPPRRMSHGISLVTPICTHGLLYLKFVVLHIPINERSIAERNNTSTRYSSHLVPRVLSHFLLRCFIHTSSPRSLKFEVSLASPCKYIYMQTIIHADYTMAINRIYK
jgi:hypothetical protein